jgi:ABC-type dipeptide/oligopeptide/nickel transport system permease subunit
MYPIARRAILLVVVVVVVVVARCHRSEVFTPKSSDFVGSQRF